MKNQRKRLSKKSIFINTDILQVFLILLYLEHNCFSFCSNCTNATSSIYTPRSGKNLNIIDTLCTIITKYAIATSSTSTTGTTTHPNIVIALFTICIPRTTSTPHCSATYISNKSIITIGPYRIAINSSKNSSSNCIGILRVQLIVYATYYYISSIWELSFTLGYFTILLRISM